MKLLKSITDFILIAILLTYATMCWCYGVKIYFDAEVESQIKIRAIK